MSLSISLSSSNPFLSFSKTISSTTPLFLHTKLAQLSLQTSLRTTIIRMGGGPRTYPGGVSKWQWKRMQAKKAKQLLKARLARERQVYEMRKRAELKAAVSELERPWEVVEKAPTLFSVRADEQVKVLADRFQKPGGFDMWTERDGPQLFETPDGIPSARFFPKGVVHSVKPYGKVRGLVDSDRRNDSERERKLEGRNLSVSGDRRDGKRNGGRYRKNESRSRSPNVDARNGSSGMDSGQILALDRKQRGVTEVRHGGRVRRINRNDGILRNSRKFDSELYDMSLQQDGRYGFNENSGEF